MLLGICKSLFICEMEVDKVKAWISLNRRVSQSVIECRKFWLAVFCNSVLQEVSFGRRVLQNLVPCFNDNNITCPQQKWLQVSLLFLDCKWSQNITLGQVFLVQRVAKCRRDRACSISSTPIPEYGRVAHHLSTAVSICHKML